MRVEKEEKEIMLYNESIKENITNWIEQDIILPDTKPDAIKVISVNVNPYVTETEIMNGMIKVTGKLNYYIIYKADDTEMGIRGIMSSVPFTQNLTVKNITQDMNVTVMPKVKNIIYALPNERKIAVKTEIIFNISANNVTKIPFIEKFKNDPSIQTKMFEQTFNNILENRCDTITSREDVMLESVNSDFGEILNVTTDIINTEYKQSYNKLLVKGDILVKMLYMPEGSKSSQLKKAEVLVPFTGMLEFTNIKDSAMFDIKYNLKDFNVKPNLDITSNKTLNIDYQIAVCAVMYEKQNINYVSDFYSETKNLNYDSKNTRVIKTTEAVTKDFEIRDTLTNALGKDYVVVDYDVDTNYLVVKNTNKILDVDGNLKLNIISQNIQNQDLDSKTLDIKVSEKLEIPDIEETSRVNVKIGINNISLDADGKNINVRISLRLYIEIENIMDISYIEDIDEEDLDGLSLDSMIIYVVKPKDTLWSIAKNYKTTPEKIATINNIENPDIISEGQKLLIIR